MKTTTMCFQRQSIMPNKIIIRHLTIKHRSLARWVTLQCWTATCSLFTSAFNVIRTGNG